MKRKSRSNTRIKGDARNSSITKTTAPNKPICATVNIKVLSYQKFC